MQRESEKTEPYRMDTGEDSDLFRARGGHAASPLCSKNEHLLHTRRKAGSSGDESRRLVSRFTRRHVAKRLDREMQTLRRATERDQRTEEDRREREREKGRQAERSVRDKKMDRDRKRASEREAEDERGYRQTVR